jgi:hypothetical protein
MSVGRFEIKVGWHQGGRYNSQEWTTECDDNKLADLYSSIPDSIDLKGVEYTDVHVHRVGTMPRKVQNVHT